MTTQSRTTKSLLISIAALFYSFGGTLAYAENNQYEIQFLLMDTSGQGANYRPKALLYKHIVPYSDLISLEGFVALGITEESETRKLNIATTYKQKLMLSNMLGLFVKVSGKIEPRVDGYLHFGVARVDFDFSTPSAIGGADGSQSATGLGYGLGLNFRILEKGAFVLEFNELPEVDAAGETFNTRYFALGYQLPF